MLTPYTLCSLTLLSTICYLSALSHSLIKGTQDLKTCSHADSLDVPLSALFFSAASLSLWQDSLLCIYLYTLTITHSHTLLITCTCCYDESKGTKDQDFSYSFSDSLPLLSHSQILPLLSLLLCCFLLALLLQCLVCSHFWWSQLQQSK